MAVTRVAVYLTHPVQYFAPWFRYIAHSRPELDLTVLYGVQPRADQQGTGFGRAFEWDLPLREGYRSRVLHQAAEADLSSDAFFGVDVPDLERAIADVRPDLMIVPGWHSISQLRALRACRRLGIPAVYRGDSNLLGRPRGVRRSAWALRTRYLLGRYDAWLSVGARSREYLRAFGVPDPLIFDSPHAVDNDRFAREADVWLDSHRRRAARHALGIEEGDLAILFAGKVAGHKRPLDVIRAAGRLGPHAVAVFAGDGDARAACEAEAERCGVRTVWLGFVNQRDMPRAYALADCLILPSSSESWGLVVNEALASGLPCVVTNRVGCAIDLVRSGASGEVAPVGDIDALAGAVRRAAGACRAEIVRRCREAVARHTFERATDGLVEAARRLSARRRFTLAGNPGTPRVLALCGGMVIVSGAERMTFEVLRVLRERGAAVHGVVNRWGSRAIVDRLDEIGASWSTGYYWYAFTRRVSLRRWVQCTWDIAMTSAGLLRDARRFRPTHVLAPEFGAALRNAPALVLLRAAGVRVVLRLGNAPDEGRFYRFLWRRLIDPLVDRFVANSAFTHRELLAHGIAPAKARIIGNTAPSRPRGRADAIRRPGRVIYVGQIIPDKGLHLLLDAIGLVASRGYDVSLDIAGPLGPWEHPAFAGYQERIRARAARPDLAHRVRFLGEREDIPALLASASVHCCPSLPAIREGFGVVTVEAKLAGTPSVVCPSGALPELVRHREDGWVCRAASAEAIAEGLEFFLSDPRRVESAGRCARESARLFSREAFAAAWADEFGLEPAQLPAAPASVA